MEQTVNLLNVEEKKSIKGAIYWSAETDKGKMSIFEKPLADDLKKVVNRSVTLETMTSGKYINIVGLVKVNQEIEKTESTMYNQTALNQASIMLSYAKDLAVAKIEAITTKTKDLNELKEEIEKIEAKVYEDAKGFMELQKSIL